MHNEYKDVGPTSRQVVQELDPDASDGDRMDPDASVWSNSKQINDKIQYYFSGSQLVH